MSAMDEITEDEFKRMMDAHSGLWKSDIRVSVKALREIGWEVRRSPSPDVAVSRDAGAGAWLLGRVTKQTDEFEGLPDNSIVRVSVHLADLRRARAAIRALSSAPSAAEGDQK